MFKGKDFHEPWVSLIEGKGVENLSRLHNVCIDLKRDALFINTKQWSRWHFGLLERLYLRKLAINLAGWLQWIETPDLAVRFKKLDSLLLRDTTTSYRSVIDKGSVIEDLIAKKQQSKSRRDYFDTLGYSPPRVRYETLFSGPLEQPWDTNREWIAYKYPRASIPP